MDLFHALLANDWLRPIAAGMGPAGLAIFLLQQLGARCFSEWWDWLLRKQKVSPRRLDELQRKIELVEAQRDAIWEMAEAKVTEVNRLTWRRLHERAQLKRRVEEVVALREEVARLKRAGCHARREIDYSDLKGTPRTGRSRK